MKHDVPSDSVVRFSTIMRNVWISSTFCDCYKLPKGTIRYLLAVLMTKSDLSVRVLLELPTDAIRPT